MTAPAAGQGTLPPGVSSRGAAPGSMSTGKASDFLVNTSGGPASASGSNGLECALQLTYGPEGSLYIADFGIMAIVGKDLHAPPGTGVLWRLRPKP